MQKIMRYNDFINESIDTKVKAKIDYSIRNEIRERKDKFKNFKRFLNEDETDVIKSGVDLVYQEHPELSDIGSQEQYSQYLDTIFPNSKIKEIVYHASPNTFTQFNDPASSGLSHIWFSEKPLTGQFGGFIYSVILDIKNPLSEWDPNYNQEIKRYESPINPEWRNNYHITGELPQFKYDGTIRKSRVDEGKSITVRNPNQIHMLGTEDDIKGFEEYIKNYVSI